MILGSLQEESPCTYDMVTRSDMTALYENIDPNGDTLIIISYLTVLTQSADEPVAAEEPAAADEPVAVEEPAAAYELGHIDGHSTFFSIDGTTHCHGGLGERRPERFFSLV